MTIHVTCAPAPGNIANGNLPVDVGALDWSETLSSAGMTAVGAPARTGRSIITVVSIDTPAWIALGSAPNASSNPRRYLPAYCSQSFAVDAGDKLAWVAG